MTIDQNSPEFWGIDLKQLEELEDRARQRLKRTGFDIDSKPLPQGSDALLQLSALVLYYGRALRQRMELRDWKGASEWMTRVRRFTDDATFGNLLQEKERRRAGATAPVSNAEIDAAMAEHRKQVDAAADLGITDRTIRNRLKPKRKR